jgi:FMN phosphatase YigB (HAD superfamily)
VSCERYSLAPENCVFIDDSAVNVAAAKMAGMQALHFTDPEKLRAELIALGLPLRATAARRAAPQRGAVKKVPAKKQKTARRR